MARSGAWVEQAKRLLASRQEAAGFLERAGQRFAASSPRHLPVVTRLWLKAEDADPLFHRLLDEMNDGLLEGRGELQTSRGASIRTLPSGQAAGQTLAAPALPPVDWEGAGLPGVPFLRARGPLFAGVSAPQEVLVYNCTWTLRWEGNGKGVTIELDVTAEEGVFLLRVSTERAQDVSDLPYPHTEEALKDALVQAFVAEQAEGPAIAPTRGAGQRAAQARSGSRRGRQKGPGLAPGSRRARKTSA